MLVNYNLTLEKLHVHLTFFKSKVNLARLSNCFLKRKVTGRKNTDHPRWDSNPQSLA